MDTPALSSRCPRYPPEIIAQCVRLSYRVPLSYRGSEERMFERGVIVPHERIRRWCVKLGPLIAAGIRRRRRLSWDKGHPNDVFIKMGGRTYHPGALMHRPPRAARLLPAPHEVVPPGVRRVQFRARSAALRAMLGAA